jgi:hypothetical protein
MSDFWVEFKNSFVRVALLYVAVPAAVVCGASLALWRVMEAFARDEPLPIAPGYEIKLP